MASPAVVVPLAARILSVQAIHCQLIPLIRSHKIWSPLTWPNDCEEALRGSSRYHNEYILSNLVLHRDQQNIADNLQYLDA
jgi:hypothetical protein